MPPDHSVQMIMCGATSKMAGRVISVVTGPAPVPASSRNRVRACTAVHALPCVVTTAFGCFVEPDVNRNFAMVSGPTVVLAASTLVGVEMGDGVNQGDTCVVEPADAASSGSLRVVWLTSGGAARYEQQRELLGVSSEVPGFGDEAFLTGTWLLAVRGDEFLSLQVVPDPLAPGERITDAQVTTAAQAVAVNAGW